MYCCITLEWFSYNCTAQGCNTVQRCGNMPKALKKLAACFCTVQHYYLCWWQRQQLSLEVFSSCLPNYIVSHPKSLWCNTLHNQNSKSLPFHCHSTIATDICRSTTIDKIYLLTAVGLSSGGSSTVHTEWHKTNNM